MKPKIGDVVMVTWQDAVDEDGWGQDRMTEMEVLDIMACKTVGRVSILSDRVIGLAQAWGVNQDDIEGNIWHIPRGMVLEMEVLWPKDREVEQMEQTMRFDPTGWGDCE